jgi:hypothetical protein
MSDREELLKLCGRYEDEYAGVPGTTPKPTERAVLARALKSLLTEREGIDPERVAQLIAHRVCHAAEHDPEHGKLHGCCIVCGEAWPCANYIILSFLRNYIDGSII